MKLKNLRNSIRYISSGKCISTFLSAALIFFIGTHLTAQNAKEVKIIGVHSGFETNNIVYKVSAPKIPELKYIRAQRVSGPQDGFFIQFGDNIRYVAKSKVSGIPGNMSKIRFTFLQKDLRTPIEGNDFRVIINDIDGPNNEALKTSCEDNVRLVGTAQTTNLEVSSLLPNLSAKGSFNEKEGPTSRVMFEFGNVSVIEFENYANDGYFKDFDFNNDYPIVNPKLVKCSKPEAKLNKLETSIVSLSSDFFSYKKSMLLIHTNPIYFDNDKWDIKAAAAIELKKVVDVLTRFPELKINLESHTDSRGDKDYNYILSKKRANSSYEWIVQQGIAANRISVEGYGEYKLVNECIDNVKCSEEKHQQNRRTEFIIVNPEVVITNNKTLLSAQ